MTRQDTFDQRFLHEKWEEIDHLKWVANLVSGQTDIKIEALQDPEDTNTFTVLLPDHEWTGCTFNSAKNLMYGFALGHLNAQKAPKQVIDPSEITLQHIRAANIKAGSIPLMTIPAEKFQQKEN